MSSPNTPMLRQYHEIRKQYPGTLLFFRLGDFYEMFYEDAEIGARELSITLTARHKETDNPVPMCGVPHHALKHYLSRLIKKGYRVALCEQVEEASAAVKLVKRKVVRVITPGTAIDEQLLEGADNQYLAAVFGAGDHMAAAFLDLSTGEFQATEFAGPDHFTNTLLQLEQFNPREILCSRSLEPLFAPHIAPRSVENLPITTEDEESADQRLRLSTVLTLLDDWSFAPEQGADFLTQHFEVTTLDGFGLSDKKWAIGASAAIVRYVRDTQMCDAKHITELSYFEPQEYMQLDAATVRNLELVEAIQGGKRETLFGTIDLTQTGMGARLLKSWLLRPSLKLGELNARLDAVGELHRQTMNRDKLRQWLTQVYDVERLLGRVSLGTANPRDLVALGSSLEPLPAMKQLLGTMKSSLLQVLYESLDELTDVRSWIGEALTESPPMKIDEGNVIRVGFHAELDSLRELRSNTQSFIAEVERRERERTVRRRHVVPRLRQVAGERDGAEFGPHRRAVRVDHAAVQRLARRLHRQLAGLAAVGTNLHLLPTRRRMALGPGPQLRATLRLATQAQQACRVGAAQRTPPAMAVLRPVALDFGVRHRAPAAIDDGHHERALRRH
ncbi:MAG TPA: hypothetical protein PLL06_08330, partial [Acidobacteriota bacterium]|nr:hypothetical protein [Acidobacteriota bacterium]